MTNPSLTFPPSIDGWIRYNAGGTWASIRAQANGTDTYPTTTSMYAASDSGTPLMGRARVSFDTSAIPDGATIISAKLRLYGVSVTGSGSLCLVQATPASHTALAVGDYSAFLTTELASRIASGSWNTSGYNEFTLNSSGLAMISKTGHTDFLLLHSTDLDNSSPGAAPNFQMYTQDQTGTANDPELVVVYSLDRAGADAISFTDSPTSVDGPHTRARVGGDQVSFTDAAVRRSPPPARSPVGSRVALFTSNGVAGTFGAHYAFAHTAVLPDGQTLLHIARKASSHPSYDGVIVGKLSTSDATVVGSEFTIIDERAGGWDWRDPYITVLASGRICITGGRRKSTGGLDHSKAPFIYTDDPTGQTGWTSPYLLSDAETGVFSGTPGSVAGGCYGSDIVEKGSELWLFGYGVHASGSSVTDLWAAKSTNGGTSFTVQTPPAVGATYGYNVVEPQVDLVPATGDFLSSFHTEDGVPTDWYRTRLLNAASSWTTPVKVGAGDTFNRQGLSVFPDGRVIVSANVWPTGDFVYYESYDATIFGSPVTVSLNAPVAGYTANLWVMVTPLGGTGDSQNVGFTFGAEVNTQDKASVWFQQMTGTNGVAVYRRGGADSVSFTDTLSRGSVTYARTGTDAISFTDTATRSAQSFARSGADSLSFTDTAARQGASSSKTGSDGISFTDTATRAATTRLRSGADALAFTDSATRSISGSSTRSGADTLAFTDTGIRSFVAIGSVTYPLHAVFVGPVSQTADFAGPAAYTADFVNEF